MDNVLDVLKIMGLNPFMTHMPTGQYSSPCPLCGGTKRFQSWPDEVNQKTGRYQGGRWWCRDCGKAGDAPGLLVEYYGYSYREACQMMNFNGSSTSCLENLHKPGKEGPREAKFPSIDWQRKAIDILNDSIDFLDTYDEGLAYLFARGLKIETINQFYLGYNGVKRNITSWFPADEKATPVWIHKGFVIPYIVDDNDLYRLRIRLETPIPIPGTNKFIRYLPVKGSSSCPMKISTDKPYVIVVESELDAVLLAQECGELIDIIGLGSLSYKPDLEVHKALKKAEKILIALDDDQDNTKALGQWNNFWKPQYPNAVLWPPLAKDPGEMYENGIDLKEWVSAGIGQEYRWD